MTKLVTFTDAKGPRVGAVLEDGRVLDLAATGSGALAGRATDMLALIEGGPAVLAAVKALAANPPAAALLPAGSVTLMAPIPGRAATSSASAATTWTMWRKATAPAASPSELPKYPQFFTKAPDTVIAPEDWVPAHIGVTEWLDYEVELVAIIGTEGTNIPRDQALRHVFGWTIGNDITGRELQRRYGQWFKGKSLDRSCPLGPWIIPADELDALNTGIRCFVNGEKRQDSNTAKMIFDVKEIIHQLSLGFTLKPGDVILTGTPEGVGYAMQPPKTLKPGDVIECEVDGIGRLKNTVKAQ
ncbi:fumarylacetoacetate hydrolase family protein [Siccirubricoccus deserti]